MPTSQGPSALHDGDTLPEGLPVPEDDGGADHLAGLELPSLLLESSLGEVNVRDFDVIYIYPRSGRPGVPLLHAGVVRLPGPARRAGLARRQRGGAVDAVARRPARVRGAERDAVPDHLRSGAAARNGAPAADVRDRGPDALPATHARGRGRSDREGLLSRLSTRRQRGRRARLAALAMKLVTYDDGSVARVD